MNREERKLLSDRFRDFCASLPLPVLQEFEFTLLNAFSVSALRNVQLWTRNNATRRNFIPAQSSTLEFDMRVHFARALLGDLARNAPSKVQQFEGQPSERGRKVRQYLTDSYISGFACQGGALIRVTLQFDGSLLFIYDSYHDIASEEGETVEADDSDVDDILFNLDGSEGSELQEGGNEEGS